MTGTICKSIPCPLISECFTYSNIQIVEFLVSDVLLFHLNECETLAHFRIWFNIINVELAAVVSEPLF